MSEPYWEPLGAAPSVPGAMACLYDSILAADAANFDIQNIPQTYRHLKMILSLRSNQAGQTDHMTLRFNNDASLTYFVLTTGWVAGSALNSYVSNGASKGACGMALGATADAGTFGDSEVRIPDYANGTKKKSFGAFSASAWSPALNAHAALMYAGIWGPLTAAINRITILPNAGTLWLVGSRVSLYGLQGI